MIRQDSFRFTSLPNNDRMKLGHSDIALKGAGQSTIHEAGPASKE
jgi:hypothetical protein